ncbi:MAG: hypothetical protein MK085_08860 [Phycisphaerales bacterium]|nr:hypothetical protein [Phycisphaerales bacterium]
MTALFSILIVLALANLVILFVVVAGQKLCASECGACGQPLAAEGALTCEACDADLSKVGISAGVVIREPKRGVLIGLAVILVLSILPLPVFFGHALLDARLAEGTGKRIERKIVMDQGDPGGGVFNLSMADEIPHADSDLKAGKWLELSEENGDTPSYRVDLVVEGERVDGLDLDTPMSEESIQAWFMKTGRFPSEEKARLGAEALLDNISRNLHSDPTAGYGVYGGEFANTTIVLSNEPVPHGPLAWVVFWSGVALASMAALWFAVWIVLRLARPGGAS